MYPRIEECTELLIRHGSLLGQGSDRVSPEHKCGALLLSGHYQPAQLHERHKNADCQCGTFSFTYH
jgi:hypothetical protein